jgi:hypothetical protein
MPILAVSESHNLARGAPGQRFYTSAKSLTGAAEDFVVVNSVAGPAKTIYHLENHQISEAYSFEWRKVRGGWIATSFAASLFRKGKLVARIGSTTKAVGAAHGPAAMVAADDPCMFDAEYAATSGNCSGTPVFQGGGGSGSGGGGAVCCARELNDYLLAAAAFATATQLAKNSGTWTDPWVAIALVALGAAAAVMASRYDDCYSWCIKASASASPSLPADVMFASIERHYYMRPA